MPEPKFFCIYSGEEQPENTRSLEHIVPYAIGGTGKFGTSDVSKDANSHAGANADGPLINHPFVTVQRWRLKIPGQSGQIPGVSFRGTIEIDSSEVRSHYLINHDGTTELTIFPEVESDWTNRTFSVSCDPKDLPEILENIVQKGKKKGLPISLDQVRVASSKHTRIEHPTLSSEMSIGLFDLVPGFAKMALGTGHFVFGEQWSRGADADLLRAVIRETNSAQRNIVPVHGQVWPNVQVDNLMRKNCFIDQDKHVIVVLNNRPVAFYALLFGQYDGFIQLADNPLESPRLPIGKGIVYVICCKTRQFASYDWEQFVTNQMIEKGYL